MVITCWGARGSIPVSGKEYLKYGGSTTCMEIRTKDDETIIIDAGSGIRRLGNKLLQEDRKKYSIIFTHAHWDHILGFPFFKPIYIKGTHIDMFGCPFAQESVKQIISRTMDHPNFPVNFDDINAKMSYHGACKEAFSIRSLTVTPILLSHPNKGIGYKFVEGDRCFVFLTDNELGYKHPGGLDYQDYLDFSSGADLLIHDSEFTEEEYRVTRKWGHSVYPDALKLALEAQVKKFGLFHHNQERTDAALDRIVEDCQRTIGESKASLECFAAYEGMEIRL
ncbi:MAG: MBL fold metallo-hydrolase [Deltaproteobacteria bacterium]|nr:MAG: MBL fold metallo-hydrolase [Deltaproteobacteria bacterium]